MFPRMAGFSSLLRTLDGNGNPVAVIDAQNAPIVAQPVSLSDPATSYPAKGGAIWAAKSVALANSVIEDGTVTNTYGGATGGGAIFAEETVAIIGSTVSDSMVSSESGNAWGGGI